MLDVFHNLFHAWREIAHIGAWTGLSLGMLAMLVALAWFDPLARNIAIVGVIIIIVVYSSMIYGIHMGASDTRAEWAAANAHAAKQAAANDAKVRAEIEAAYTPQIQALQAQADDYERQVERYERIKKNGRCVLGTGPLQLRHR